MPYGTAGGPWTTWVILAGISAPTLQTHLIQRAVLIGGAARDGDCDAFLEGISGHAWTTLASNCCKTVPQLSYANCFISTWSFLTQILTGTIKASFSQLTVLIRGARWWGYRWHTASCNGCVILRTGALDLMIYDSAGLSGIARIASVALVNTNVISARLGGWATWVCWTFYYTTGNSGIPRVSRFTSTFCSVLNAMTIGIYTTRVFYLASISALVFETNILFGTVTISCTLQR